MFSKSIFNTDADLDGKSDRNGDKQCLRDLVLTDPREDKARIQEIKGGLLRDSYYWIVEHADFRQFLQDPHSHLS